MILAEKITQLRKLNGMSQEELAEQLGVSRQSISKWESAQSVPDLKRILGMAELFGVSTDMLLKDDLTLDDKLPAVSSLEETGQGTGAYTSYSVPEAPVLTPVSMEDANTFLRMKALSAGRIAVGVMLCILSPIVLCLLGAAQDAKLISITEKQAAGLGVLVLMLMVGCAIGIFIYYGMKMSRWDYISKDSIETAYGVSGMVSERKERYNPSHTRFIIIGVLLCVLSCIPMFIGLMFNGNDMLMVITVCLLLVMVGIGVMLIVRTCTIMGGFQALLEEGEFSRESKEENRRNDSIMSIYWMAATALYLAISFLTNRWDISWVVWPIAGVCSALVGSILRVVRSKE